MHERASPSRVHAEGDPGVNALESRKRVNGLAAASSAEAMFAVDADQRVIAWNSEAARVFGHSAAAAIGEHCYTLVAAADEVGHRFCRLRCPVIRASLTGTAPSPLQLQARVRGGEHVLVEVSTIVLGSEGTAGTVIHLCRPVARTTGTGESDNGGAAASEPLPLTRRERQVLAALCRGETTEEIARTLGLTPTTVRNHVQHLLAKLAVHSRMEVVAMAYRDGLVR